MRRTALACLCLFVFATSAFAQAGGVYNWNDAKGVTHYADTPPPGGHDGNVQADAAKRMAPPAEVDPRCTTARSSIQQLNSVKGRYRPGRQPRRHA